MLSNPAFPFPWHLRTDMAISPGYLIFASSDAPVCKPIEDRISPLYSLVTRNMQPEDAHLPIFFFTQVHSWPGSRVVIRVLNSIAKLISVLIH